MRGNIWKTDPCKSGHIHHGEGIETWEPSMKRKPHTPLKLGPLFINYDRVLYISENDYEKTLGIELKLKI